MLCIINISYYRFIMFISGVISPDVLAMLHSKGHNNIQPMQSADPVTVNVVAKKNEDVWGYTDTTGGASVY